jgi:hypothetical protein
VLEASRASWFEYQYEVTEDGAPVGKIQLSQVGERALLLTGSEAYTVRREGMKVYKLETETAEPMPAAALREIALYPVFRVDYAGRSYRLESDTVPTWEYAIKLDGLEVGSIALERALHTPVEGTFPPEIPLPVRLFMMTLAIFTRKRATDYAAMTSTLTRG